MTESAEPMEARPVSSLSHCRIETDNDGSKQKTENGVPISG